MEWTDYQLRDGRRLSVGRNDDGIYAALDGEHLAGPMEPQLVRVRVQVPLPDGGTVGLRLDYDDSLLVDQDGAAVSGVDEGSPRLAGDAPAEVRNGMKTLWLIGVLNAVAGIAAQLWPDDIALDPTAMWIVSLLYFGLAAWVMVAPRQAAWPLGIAIVLLVLDSIWLVRNGYAGGIIVRLFLIRWLVTGLMTATGWRRPRAPSSARTGA